MKSSRFNAPLQGVGFSLLALLGGLLVAGFAEDKPEATATSADGPEGTEDLQRILNSIARLHTENARLKEENVRLRKENQQLRRLLGEKIEVGAGAAAPAPTAATNGAGGLQTHQVEAATDGKSSRWLSSADGKRHNSNCRYFKTTEGKPCGPDEGKPCKLCGG
jgi:hypothetical protein